MHELSYLIRLAGIASESAEANHAKSVDTVTVAVGEMTGLVPEYLRRYWPQAVKGTILEGSALAIEEIPAEVHCSSCGETYQPKRENQYCCPSCGSSSGTILHGREFMVQSITIEN